MQNSDHAVVIYTMLVIIVLCLVMIWSEARHARENAQRAATTAAKNRVDLLEIKAMLDIDPVAATILDQIEHMRLEPGEVVTGTVVLPHQHGPAATGYTKTGAPTYEEQMADVRAAERDEVFDQEKLAPVVHLARSRAPHEDSPA